MVGLIGVMLGVVGCHRVVVRGWGCVVWSWVVRSRVVRGWVVRSWVMRSWVVRSRVVRHRVVWSRGRVVISHLMMVRGSSMVVRSRVVRSWVVRGLWGRGIMVVLDRKRVV